MIKLKAISFNSFLTAQKAVGAKGFKAIFTEIRDPGSSCDQFRCASSGYCIQKNLHCNSITNCGHFDQSDELDCECSHSLTRGQVLIRGSCNLGKRETKFDWVVIGGAALAATLLVIIIICSLCHRKSKRRRSNVSIADPFDISRPKPPQFEIPPSLHFLPMDNV